MKYVSAGLSLTIGGVLDPRDYRLSFIEGPISGSGAVSIMVFIDYNENGIFDGSDKPLKGVVIMVNQQESDYITKESGVAIIPLLRPHSPTDISVAPRSLEFDPHLKAFPRGVRLVPRLGKVAEVLLPVVIRGEIDGTVVHNGNPVGNIEVELVDTDHQIVTIQVTDKDGYFLFDELPPCQYELRIPERQLKRLQLRPSPQKRSIRIDPKGSFEGGQDFILLKKR